jgi:hypothetical protein
MTADLGFEGSLGSEGRGYQLWPEGEGSLLAHVVAKGLWDGGKLFRLKVQGKDIKVSDLGLMQGPAIRFGTGILHARSGSTDVWYFDPATGRDSLYFQGPAVEPFHGGDGVDYPGRPAIADLQGRKGGALFWGLELTPARALPQPLTFAAQAFKPRGALAASLSKAFNDSFYVGEGDPASQTGPLHETGWSCRPSGDGGIECQWDGRILAKDKLTVVLRGRAYRSGEEDVVFFTDRMNLTRHGPTGKVRRFKGVVGGEGGAKELKGE